MTFTRAWLHFRRMQDSVCAAAVLIYANATLDAWMRLPGDSGFKTAVLLAFPAAFLVLTVLVSLGVRPVRRFPTRYVWLSFESGFGQTVLSVLTGMGVLIVVAVLIYVEVGRAAGGARYPAGAFSGLGAGIGILFVQAVLVRDLQRDEAVRPRITV